MTSKTARVDRDKALSSAILHREDHRRNQQRLQRLYGKVARVQNRVITENCWGSRILDVGAGYGNLTGQLLDSGKDAIGIEIDEEKVKRAREWFGVELELNDFLTLESPDGSFDTVIFREVLNHLPLRAAFEKCRRLTKKRCLVFQGTETIALRAAKLVYGHREYDQKTPEHILEGLENTGFEVRQIRFSDTVAYPLSGGWHGHCLVPPSMKIESMLLRLDSIATSVVNSLNLGRYLCFRTLIVADRT